MYVTDWLISVFPIKLDILRKIKFLISMVDLPPPHPPHHHPHSTPNIISQFTAMAKIDARVS
jgi:hypothetical protein